MPDIKRVVIENFQSHEKTEMEFSPGGLTVIVGPSDSGKSAIIRALRWLFFNEPRGSDFVRAGASGPCRVSAELDNGVIVTRERDGNRNRYILESPDKDRMVFEGFGNEPPAEIVKAHGMVKVPLDTDLSICLNLAQQLEGPFLISETGAVRARAIGRVSGVHILDAAIRAASREAGQYESERKALLDKIGELDNELKEYSDLQDIENRLKQVEQIREEVKVRGARLETCIRLRSEIRTADEGLKGATGMLERLSPLDQAFSYISRADSLTSRLAELARRRDSLEQVENDILAAQTILNGTEGIGPVGGYLDELSRIKEKLQRMTSLRQDLARLDRELAGVVKVLDRTSAIYGIARQVEAMPDLKGRLKLLGDQRTLLARVDKELREARNDMLLAEEEIKRLIPQYEEVLKALGKCPVCFGDITPETAERIAAEYGEIRGS
ncbi:MAG TPA: AAA family ATPase [Firmicutes bacterium]|nr:AAA family ATPase [Bacillota bacterium]